MSKTMNTFTVNQQNKRYALHNTCDEPISLLGTSPVPRQFPVAPRSTSHLIIAAFLDFCAACARLKMSFSGFNRLVRVGRLRI